MNWNLFDSGILWRKQRSLHSRMIFDFSAIQKHILTKLYKFEKKKNYV